MNKFFFYTSFIMCFLSYLFSSAQLHVKKYDWTSSTDMSIIPDSLKDEDAVMVNSNHWISNAIINRYRYSFMSTETIFQRIKFQTQRGVNEFSKVFLMKSKEQSFNILDARTIKPNGKVIKLTDDDLKQLDLGAESTILRESGEQIRFSIPGVEIGDEVEFVYSLVAPRLNSGTDVFLFSYLPCLTSSFNYMSGTNIKSDIENCGSMTDPDIIHFKDYTSFFWQMKGLPAVIREENSIPALSLPYISISVRSVQVKAPVGPRQLIVDHDIDISPSSWSDLFDSNISFLNEVDSLANEDNEAFNKFVFEKAGIPGDSGYYHFLRMYEFISDSLTIAEQNEMVENKPLLYYLRNYKIDRLHYFVLTRKLMKLFGLKYYMGFARNKYEGVLDSMNAASHHISEKFFAYNSPENKIHFLFVGMPSRTYYLDEVPDFLEGTLAFMVSETKDETGAKEVRSVKFPFTSLNINYHIEKMKININFTKNDDNYDLKDCFSGNLSVEYRNQLLKLQEMKNFKEPLQSFFPEGELDSAFITKNSKEYPCPFEVRYYFKCPTLLNEIDSSVYSISIKKLIHFSIIPGLDKKRTLDYYPEHKYHHQCIYQLNFDRNIEILNADKLNQVRENEFGTFRTVVQKLTENVIRFELDYSVKSIKLPKEKYSDIKEMQQWFENFINTGILIKKS
jgi:hypothetical protein